MWPIKLGQIGSMLGIIVGLSTIFLAAFAGPLLLIFSLGHVISSIVGAIGFNLIERGQERGIRFVKAAIIGMILSIPFPTIDTLMVIIGGYLSIHRKLYQNNQTVPTQTVPNQIPTVIQTPTVKQGSPMKTILIMLTFSFIVFLALAWSGSIIRFVAQKFF